MTEEFINLTPETLARLVDTLARQDATSMVVTRQDDGLYALTAVLPDEYRGGGGGGGGDQISEDEPDSGENDAEFDGGHGPGGGF